MDHHLIKNAQICSTEKLSARDLYSIAINNDTTKPTSQEYFEKKFELLEADWKSIYTLPRIITTDSQLRYFQYKILNNILFLNKKLHLFSLHHTPLCSFCVHADETPIHLFGECYVTLRLWKNVAKYFRNNINLPVISPQSAIFGFHQIDQNSVIINLILLLFKHYVYISRDTGTLSLGLLLKKIKKVNLIERHIAQNDERRKRKFNHKWKKIQPLIS